MTQTQEGVDSRLIVLEEKAEYQEYNIEKLNEALVAQQVQLDSLEEKIKRLDEKLSAGLLEHGDTDDSTPPPHY